MKFYISYCIYNFIDESKAQVIFLMVTIKAACFNFQELFLSMAPYLCGFIRVLDIDSSQNTQRQTATRASPSFKLAVRNRTGAWTAPL